MCFKKLQLCLFIFSVLLILFIAIGLEAVAEEPAQEEVKTSAASMISRVAPGELLPISVKLINFGRGKRVDVLITYQILDSNGRVMLEESETKAVETTMSHVKIIQIPEDLPSGKYTVLSRISYKGQEAPAISQFQFTVEKKITGIFISQFILYAGIVLVIGIAFAIVSRLIIKRQRASRLKPHDYPNVSKKERMFYEIISDIIMQMRYRAGDKALKLAKSIQDLVIDEKNGRVLKINKSPAKIIALLVLQYEKHLGRKISFALRKPSQQAKSRLAAVEKNLVIVRRYFE